MNQIARHDRQFSALQRIVPFRPEPCRAPVEDRANWPGWVGWLGRGWKLYLGARRTRIALDSLSHEQLKDIGFRRVTDGNYQRLL